MPIGYFLATKLAAYEDRGGKDIRLSHDMEDIVAVVDGNSRVVESIANADFKVRKYIAGHFRKFFEDQALLEEAIAGYIRAAGEPPGRVRAVISKVESIAKILGS